MKRLNAEELKARNALWVAAGVTCAWLGCAGGLALLSIAYPDDTFPWWALVAGIPSVIGAVTGLLIVPAAWSEWGSRHRVARESSVEK